MLAEILTEKFKASRYSDVKEWFHATKCPLSYYNCTLVLHQGKEPTIKTFITMAHLLGFTPAEISAICKDAGDKTFWKLIGLTSEFTEDEKEIVARIRKLNDPKMKLLKDLLTNLGV